MNQQRGPDFTILSEIAGDVTTLLPKGDLGVGSEQLFEEAVGQAISGNSKKIIVDMNGSEYINSASIAIIVTCAGQLKQSDRTLEIINANSNIRRLFEIIGLPNFVRVA